VYVANHESNFLSGYTVNKSTGALTPIAPATLTPGDSPHASVFDKTGKFLYVVNGIASAQITANTVNADGTLTRIGAPIPTGAHSHNLGIDPSGRFIYVASQDSVQIFGFAVDQTTGALTAVPGSPYPGVSGPLHAVVDHDTKFAYVSNSGGEIQAFTIDPTSGALTPLSPVAVFPSGGAFAHTIVIDHTGNFVFTGNINSNNVSAFQINHTTGALTAVQGSPFASGNLPEGVTLHPTDQVLFVTNFADQNVSRFSINSTTGQLSPIDTFQDPAVAAGTVNGPISMGITN
jgi:6-phosphogluconolactonase (cycloisomerase 2 family)